MIFLTINNPRLTCSAHPFYRQRSLQLSALLLVMTGFLSSGCGKSETSQTASGGAAVQAPTQTLLSHVPKDTWGFVRANLTNPDVQKVLAKNLQKLDPAQAMMALEQQTSIPEGDREKYKTSVKLAFTLYDMFIDEGMFPSDKGQGTIEEAIGEAHYIPETKKFDGGVLIRTRTPGEKVLSQLEAALKKHEMDSEKKSDSELVLTIEGTKVYVKSSDNLIAISQSPETASSLLGAATEPAPILKEAEAKIPAMSNEGFVLYSSLKSLVQHIDGNEELKKQFPLESVQFATNIDGTLVKSHGSANFNQENPTVSSVLKQLADTKATTGGAFPPDKEVAFAFRISDVAIKTLISSIAKSADAAESAEFSALLPLLNQIGSLDVGLVQGGVASPFPEIYLASHTTQGESLKTALKEIGTQTITPMMGGMNWTEKKIGDLSADVISSPLGIGLYLAATKDKLIVSTGQSSLSFQATEAKGPAITDASLLAKTSTTTGTPVVTCYTDGEKLARILKDVSSMAASFTGGKSPIDEATLTSLQAQKESYATVSAFPDRIDLLGWAVVPK